jgi:hypothetical protein
MSNELPNTLTLEQVMMIAKANNVKVPDLNVIEGEFKTVDNSFDEFVKKAMSQSKS